MSDHASDQNNHDEPAVDSEVRDANSTELPTRPTMDHSLAQGHESEGAFQSLAEHSRQLLQVVKNLDNLGINATLPSLPKLIVVGDQSAGKSSLIEALCDIRLPRNEGTCTRCPFEITTTSCETGQWTCKISIQSKYYYDGRIREGLSGVKFDGWCERDKPTTIEFMAIDSKDNLETALRRAQLAVLNPNEDSRSFVDAPLRQDDGDERFEVGFSPNMICLQIASAGLPELSLCDLPGVINVHPDPEQQHLVNFIETLVKGYLADQNTLVLFARALNTDADTATTEKFINQCKATQRCTGVMTKPDLNKLDGRNLKILQNILRGGGHVMGGGWHVTRQLSQEEVNQQISYTEAREIEQNFFGQTPWCNALQDWQQCFGIPNLQVALSRKLTAHIVSKLPDIRAPVECRLQEIENELRRFREPTGAPMLIVGTELNLLKDAIITEINPSSEEGFRANAREIISKMNEAIKISCQPIVVLSTPGYVKPSITVASDSEPDPTSTPSKSRKVGNGRKVDATPSRAQLTPTNRPTRKIPTPQKKGDAASQGGKATFYLNVVKKLCDKSPAAELGNQTSQKLREKLIGETMCGWEFVMDHALQEIKDCFSKTLENRMMEVLHPRRGAPLFDQARSSITNLFIDLMNEQAERLRNVLACERHRPITYAADFGTKLNSEKEQLRAQRAKHRAEEHIDKLESDGQKVSQQLRNELAGVDGVNKTLGADSYEREVDALAFPLAYYGIVTTQFVDTTAKGIACNVLYTFQDRLYTALHQDLNTSNSEQCARLLQEAPQREAQRIKLVEERGKLVCALKELDGLSVTGA